MARTVLYDAHVKLGAQIVDFHGWDMPIKYSGIIDEHKAVRTAVGLFDLSHMGRVWVGGPDRKKYLQKIVTIDVGSMPSGRCKYTFLLTEKGTVIDDLICSEDTSTDRFFLVVNASNREKDLEWMQKHATGLNVKIDDQTSKVALVAVQGPKSIDAIKAALDFDPSMLKYYTMDYFSVLGARTLVSRTGYTGEDGFEIYIQNDKAHAVWDALLAKGKPLGILPIGLGARDTLRTEASMPLYGNDLDDQTTPVEAGLNFALSDKVEYVGRAVIDAQKKGGATKKLVGLHVDGKRVPRTGMDLYSGGVKTGVVTSGTWSPTFDKPIGMGYVKPQHATGAVEIDVRGKREKATIVPMPFYKRAK